jgi:hypothetical protein
MGEWLLSRRDSAIVAWHDHAVPSRTKYILRAEAWLQLALVGFNSGNRSIRTTP